MLPENLSSGNSLVVSLESAANQLFVRSPNAVGKGLYVAKGDAQVSQDERVCYESHASNYFRRAKLEDISFSGISYTRDQTTRFRMLVTRFTLGSMPKLCLAHRLRSVNHPWIGPSLMTGT